MQTGKKMGECWSDAPDDPVKSALTEYGTDTGIHVDHIRPKVPVGYNAYSNAQVTSAKYNTSKGSKKVNYPARGILIATPAAPEDWLVG